MKLIRSTPSSRDVDGDLADGLRGVAVQRHAALAADRGDLGERLDHADLVVGEHDADQRRVVAERVGDLLRVEPAGARAAVLLDVEQRHVVAAAREARQRIEHGLVLGADADEVIAAAARALGDAADGEVVAFGGAAGEDDLRGRGADRRSDRRPRPLDGLARRVAERVADAAGVAVLLREVRQHRLDDARVDARRGVVVEVDEERGWQTGG